MRPIFRPVSRTPLGGHWKGIALIQAVQPLHGPFQSVPPYSAQRVGPSRVSKKGQYQWHRTPFDPCRMR